MCVCVCVFVCVCVSYLDLLYSFVLRVYVLNIKFFKPFFNSDGVKKKTDSAISK